MDKSLSDNIMYLYNNNFNRLEISRRTGIPLKIVEIVINQELMQDFNRLFQE